MSSKSIHAYAQDKNNYKADKKITTKHWKIYYYLLSVSKYNAQKRENHRYIYRKDFNISQCCRTLGIKSNQTFYNALKNLEKYGLIRTTSDYYFVYSKDWVEIKKTTLSNLITYSYTKEDDIDLLRLFLILKKLDLVAETKAERAFTARSMSILLGHGDGTTKYYSSIRIYLGALSYWGLIELKTHKEYSPNLGDYVVYHLQNVKEEELKEDFEINEEAEKNAPLMSKELMNKLKFSFPEILDIE